MKKKLLNISGKIEPYLKPLEIIKRVADKQQIPIFIVGATARDMILQHAYGINTGRATYDLDIAISVSNWQGFASLFDALLETGQFTPDKIKQRLWFTENQLPVDLIPFGEIARGKGAVHWPPDYGTELDILGFEEAWLDAMEILVDEERSLAIKCSSIAGLTVMKLIAWHSRNEQSNKDAADLALFFRYYAEAGNIDRLYKKEALLLEEEAFNLEIAAIRLLGRDIGRMLQEDSKKRIIDILIQQTDEDTRHKLAEDLAGYYLEKENQLEQNLLRLQKLLQGIEEVHST